MPQLKETVERLLKKSRITKPPIPIERIAEDHGLDVRLAPFDGDLSGALIRSEDETYIGVNSSHHPNRQRFTIAHELAHYFLHTGLRVHIDKDFWVNWRDENSSKAVKWEEIEANRFASELLMPTDFVIRDINRLRRLDSHTPQFLAKRYKVSPQAMQIRLTILGLVVPESPASRFVLSPRFIE
jgi:Zn-dependent peptidase ImmA (M78 family)